MDKLLNEIIKLYDFKSPQFDFIRHNENITYKVTDDNTSYELRIHKPIEGFSLGIYQKDIDTTRCLESEMLLIDYACQHMDAPMQNPLANKAGEFVSIFSDGTPVTILKWVPGYTIDNTAMTTEIGESIGIMIAKLHSCFAQLNIASDNIVRCEIFNRRISRYTYNQKLLDLVKQEIFKAVEKKQIRKDYALIMEETLHIVKNRMDELSDLQNMYGIVHADLSPSNLVLSDGQIVPIDFSLSGFGFYYMDIGMVLSQYNDFGIRNSIKSGYEKVIGKQVLVRYIESFFALGVLLYIACQHDRVCTQNWFGGAIDRWCNTIFTPLNCNRNFVL